MASHHHGVLGCSALSSLLLTLSVIIIQPVAGSLTHCGGWKTVLGTESNGDGSGQRSPSGSSACNNNHASGVDRGVRTA